MNVNCYIYTKINRLYFQNRNNNLFNHLYICSLIRKEVYVRNTHSAKTLCRSIPFRNQVLSRSVAFVLHKEAIVSAVKYNTRFLPANNKCKEVKKMKRVICYTQPWFSTSISHYQK
jgi:hypothetical protein